MSTVIGRRHFVLFLEPLKASALIGFYTSVEELKHAAKTAYHQLGAEIFYTYVRAPSSEIKVDKVSLLIVYDTNKYNLIFFTGCP